MNTNIENRVKNIVSSMTLEEKIGQMFIVRCPQENAEKAIKDNYLGGVTLYDVDFENCTKEEFADKIKSYNSNSKIPLFIAIDEEGGRVCRASNHKEFRDSAFPYPQELVKNGGIDAVYKDALEKGDFLKSLGINLDFAPVCDISSNKESFIYDRTYGASANETCKYIVAAVKGMKEKNLCSTLKHFPGYGDNLDTHIGTSVDQRDYDTFITKELLPFIEGIRAGADLVMISHNIVQCLDKECPSSLSYQVHKLLRENLGYDGIIVTDSLDMDAVTLYTNDESSAVRAILCGNDLLCCTNYKTQISAVLCAVQNGKITESRIDESVKRLISKKIEKGIIS